MKYYWPGMRSDVENHVRECDECQRRKQTYEYTATLSEVRQPSYQLEIISMDICCPYAVTPRKNRYLLTFNDCFSRYAEAIPPTDTTVE
jgi:hypothetical protein